MSVLSVEKIAVVECLDCAYRYTSKGGSATNPPGTMALRRGREHARAKNHQVLVHRTTEYDGRGKP